MGVASLGLHNEVLKKNRVCGLQGLEVLGVPQEAQHRMTSGGGLGIQGFPNTPAPFQSSKNKPKRGRNVSVNRRQT